MDIFLNLGFQTVHFNKLPECNWVALGIPRWPRSPELTRPAVRERGLDDVMLLDFLFLFVAIKEKEIKLRGCGGVGGGTLAVFCPSCGGARAVIKDWLVLMWSCCHGGILYLTGSGIDAVDREDPPSVIYLKENLHFPI